MFGFSTYWTLQAQWQVEALLTITVFIISLLVALVLLSPAMPLCRGGTNIKLAFLAATVLAAYLLSPGENSIGLTHIFTEHDSIVLPLRHKLLTHCRGLSQSRALFEAARNFTLEQRYDYSDKFQALVTRRKGEGQQQQTVINWWDLAEAAREHLVERNVNHSIFSNKVSLFKVFNESNMPTPIAFGAFEASELLTEVSSSKVDEGVEGRSSSTSWRVGAEGKVCAAVEAAWRAKQSLLLKPSHCVQAKGRFVFEFQENEEPPCEEVLPAVKEILDQRAIKEAFHMHTVPPGVMMQSLWKDSPPRAMIPRLVKSDLILGDSSVQELKVVVVWGKTVLIHARSTPSLKYILPPMRSTSAGKGEWVTEVHGNAPTAWAANLHAERLIKLAETIAHASGIPSLRVDFFANPDGSWALNEIEVMQGERYDEPAELDSCMASLWLEPHLELLREGKLKIHTRSDEAIIDSIRSSVDAALAAELGLS